MRISPRKLLFVALTFGFYFVGGISQAYAAVTTNFPVFGTTLFTDTVISPTSTLNFQVTTDNQSDLNLGVDQGEWGIQTKHVPGTQVFSNCYPYNL